MKRGKAIAALLLVFCLLAVMATPLLPIALITRIALADSPNQPSNQLPSNGAYGVSLTPTLYSSAFSDPDVGDTHAASQWQISTTSGDYSSPVFDSGTDTSTLIQITIPSETLNYSNTYYWRVRHQDNNSTWSIWSTETYFITITGIPQVEWSRTFGGTDFDEGYSVQQTSDGGYIIAGCTGSYGAGEDDVWLIKTDASGDEQWNKTFGGTGFDEGYSIQQTSDGGYIITGYTCSYNGLFFSYWELLLIKTDPNGNEQWNKTFGNKLEDDEIGYSVQQTSDGGYIVSGYIYSHLAHDWDIRLIKTDASGDEQWKKTFGGTGLDEGHSVQQTPDGGYIITGWTRSYGAGEDDVWLLKTDASGDEQWNKTFGGPESDSAESVQQTSDGGYIITGWTRSYGAGKGDIWLIKTDSSGDEQWNKTFGGPENDSAMSVQQTSDGAYAIAGTTVSYGAGNGDVWLIKVIEEEDQPPNQPSNTSPPDDATSVSLTPTLQSSAFSDPDADDTHASSQWQATTVFGDYSSPVFDSGTDTSNLTQITIPSETLNYGITYYWHIRHRDNRGAWSAWSIETSFTTHDPNQPPNQPTNTSPSNGASSISLTPTLYSSAFSDPDAGDTHASSEWQATTAPGDYSSPVFQRITTGENLTHTTISPGTLDYYTTYYWHVRHKDNKSTWSEWSTETYFTTSTSAIPRLEWDKTFGGLFWNGGHSVQQTGDGGYIIAGVTTPEATGDVWLIKTSSDGTEEWNKTFGGPEPDIAYSVQQTTDGGYIIAGSTYQPSGGLPCAWLIKTDSSGNELWDKRFGGITEEIHAHSVQQTTDGGYIVADYTWSSGNSDLWLIKTDSNGNEEWNETFGGAGFERGESVQQTDDGGYIIAGYSESFGAGGKDVWLLKTNPSGTEEWNKTFGGADDDWAKSLRQTNDGGYILAGMTGSYGAGLDDLWLIKTDSSGTEEWNKTFGGSGDDWAESVQQTTDGGYIVAGSTSSYGEGSSDVWLIKIDSSGNEQWNTTFGGVDHDNGNSVQQVGEGEYIIAGYTRSYGAGSADIWLLKTVPNHHLSGNTGLLHHLLLACKAPG